ncbi:hypothetical protein [Microvirga tunisiensis]|uniref:Uncharacterized protein n=1 Tax=Microvirga tunisiensis TaxID=2108360 RepID=A0A5N7MU55_9HYPH|nr:hypothetical protein [Microvirga tunisiensis]MPR12516.1 hypothetical protein [Microvirga tunisiensis]MPR30418.1 hypothetical protein [Microvirga tunisiensis]
MMIAASGALESAPVLFAFRQMKHIHTDGLEFGETDVNPLPILTPLFRAERSGHCIVLGLKTFFNDQD